MSCELLYHVTALSNLALGYDKYSGAYDKSKLPHSTFPGQFFLLTREELDIGIAKAKKLVSKLGLAGDRPVVLATRVAAGDLHPNLRTGLGRFILSDSIALDSVNLLSEASDLLPLVNEEAMALSLQCLEPSLKPYGDLAPRSVSILPIARACQASCLFCFSEASASTEQKPDFRCLSQLDYVCAQGKARGAQRLVITGGGEPGILPHRDLTGLIRTGASHFPKVVLISNGVHLARKSEQDRVEMLADYAQAGLSVLAISRHHHDAAENRRIMGLDTQTELVLHSMAQLQRKPAGGAAGTLPIRLICVLQKGGVEDGASLRAYLDWAVSQGVGQLCFKELYVSTTSESAYHDAPSNGWSRDNQVSLAMLTHELEAMGFTKVSALPWGSPVYQGLWAGASIQIAAYTEPSVTWERTQGIARSWNLMANGDVLASLEDPRSLVLSRAKTFIPIFEAAQLPQTQAAGHA